MEAHILIVEDEQALRALLRDYLKKANFAVVEAANGEQAIHAYDSGHIDLVVLDIMLPGRSGFDVLRHIRESAADVPIIMLTAREDEDSEVTSFRLKADDYVTKPFSMKSFIARIEALLRRYKKADIQPIGVLEYCKSLYDVKLLGERLYLTKREFDLFTCLMINEGLVLTREQLVFKVWGYEYEGDTRIVDTYIRLLRKKLTSQADYIRTVWGIGYRFEVR